MQPKDIARELEERGVTLRNLQSADYEFLCPFDPEGDPILYEWARGSGSAGFSLVDQDVDLLYLVGFEKDRLARNPSFPITPGVQAQYVVTDIGASLALDAQRSQKRKGFLGLGGSSGFEWRIGWRARMMRKRNPRARQLGAIANWLNEDKALEDMLSAGEYGCIYVDPDLVNDCVIVWRRDLITSPAEIAEFLAPANIIARRAKILARWGGV